MLELSSQPSGSCCAVSPGEGAFPATPAGIAHNRYLLPLVEAALSWKGSSSLGAGWFVPSLLGVSVQHSACWLGVPPSYKMLWAIPTLEEHFFWFFFFSIWPTTYFCCFLLMVVTGKFYRGDTQQQTLLPSSYCTLGLVRGAGGEMGLYLCRHRQANAS